MGSSENEFSCNVCRVKCESEKARKGHVKKCHPDQTRVASCKSAAECFCDKCGKRYASLKARNDHVNKCHSDQTYSCHYCGYTSKYRANILRHVKSHFHAKSYSATSKQEYSCVLCPLPEMAEAYRTHQRRKMLEHYAEKHEVCLVPSILDFKNDDDFKAWKARVEKDQQCSFVTFSGTIMSPNKVIRRFRCFRDGFYYSKGVGKRRLKLSGSSKIGGICPASISASLDRKTGAIRVSYIYTHVGHSKEISRLTLRKEERFKIAQKIAAQVPFEAILSDVQEVGAERGIERVNLLTRKDLWNIAQSFNLTKTMANQSVDSSKVNESMSWDEGVPTDSNSTCQREVEQKSSFDHLYHVVNVPFTNDQGQISGFPEPDSDETSDVDTKEPTADDPPQPKDISCSQPTTSGFDVHESKEKLRQLFENILNDVTCSSDADIVGESLRSTLSKIQEIRAHEQNVFPQKPLSS